MQKKPLPRVLCVDDEPNVLAGLSRHLRGQFEAVMAVGPSSGLETFGKNGGFPVVMSDLMMPEMDGLTFLQKIRERAPDTVCVLLTGNADLHSAIAALNNGNVFRFLTKPCPADSVRKVLVAAINQYYLKTAERDVLERTLNGSVKLLTEVLGLVNPEAFSRANRVKSYVRHMIKKLGTPDGWQLELAAMLSQLGCVTLPNDLLEKLREGQPLSEQENTMFQGHPEVAQRLLSNIPRLETVAAIIGRQHQGPPASGQPIDEMTAKASILRTALAFDRLIDMGTPAAEAMQTMGADPTRFEATTVSALAGIQTEQEESTYKMVTIYEMTGYMVLAQDVVAANGTTLVRKGFELSPPLIERLKRFDEGIGVEQPIRVRARKGKMVP